MLVFCGVRLCHSLTTRKILQRSALGKDETLTGRRHIRERAKGFTVRDTWRARLSRMRLLAGNLSGRIGAQSAGKSANRKAIIRTTKNASTSFGSAMTVTVRNTNENQSWSVCCLMGAIAEIGSARIPHSLYGGERSQIYSPNGILETAEDAAYRSLRSEKNHTESGEPRSTQKLFHPRRGDSCRCGVRSYFWLEPCLFVVKTRRCYVLRTLEPTSKAGETLG